MLNAAEQKTWHTELLRCVGQEVAHVAGLEDVDVSSDMQSESLALGVGGQESTTEGGGGVLLDTIVYDGTM